MYYKFSGVTQKLTGTAPATAYSPQGLKPGVPAEAPPGIFATPTKLVSEGAPTGRTWGTNREMQRYFQRDNGLPVYLKGNYADKLLYRTTMALALGGTVYCVIALYMAAHPRK